MKSSAHSLWIPGAYQEETVQKACEEGRHALGGKSSLILAFVSPSWRPHLDDLVEVLQIHGHSPQVLGGSGACLIEGEKEYEDHEGCTLLFLHLPKTKIHTYILDDLETDGLSAESLGQKILPTSQPCGWIALGNPAQMDADSFLHVWNQVRPGDPCYGGLISGGETGDDLFFFGNQIIEDTSLILIGFEGGIHLQGILSQGCRPIGEPMTITKAKDNLVYQLGTKPAYEMLQETFRQLPSETQSRAHGNILAGLAVNEYADDYQKGDFLIRSIIAGDAKQGVLALGTLPRLGQTMQFQLRDAQSAHEDFTSRLSQTTKQHPEPFAALLFSCLARGTSLFKSENHDARCLRETYPDLPLSGLFCNGEIASVSGEVHLHSFSASALLFIDA